MYAKIYSFFTYWLCCIFFSATYAFPCLENEIPVIVAIQPDAWTADENTWELTDDLGTVFLIGSEEGDTICVSDTTCLVFTIRDTYGDGFVAGLGNYQVFYADSLVAMGDNFGTIAIHQFGNCKVGSSCFFPKMIQVEEEQVLKVGEENWYQFTPTENGQFSLRNCLVDCSSKIWLYNRCDDIFLSDTQEGSIAYQSDTCSLTTNLVAQETYYIRLKMDSLCLTDSTTWKIIYEGPIVGCMDTIACNYHPLATISEPTTCLYQGDENCPAQPDLIVDEQVLKASLKLERIYTTDDCFVEEQCLANTGHREVIQFTTAIKNIGGQDFYLGPPPPLPEQANQQWEWDVCHQHWHYEGYAEYLLYNEAIERIPVGFKNGFCVLDSHCPTLSMAKYNCLNQGLSAGCSDIYAAGIACQWIDITEVPAGQYTLVVRVNWQQEPDALGRYESNYYNNWAQVCIDIQKDSVTKVEVVESCSPYTDCFGEIYGAYVKDCEGVCGGTRLIGDIDQNQTYTEEDILTYIDLVLGQRNEFLNDCTDLDGDEKFTLMDVVQLTQCMIAESEVHLDSFPNLFHHHCQLPVQTVRNKKDTTYFQISKINTQEQYLEVSLKHPRHALKAYQFQLTGIDIDHIQPLYSSMPYDAQVFTHPTGKVLVTSLTGSQLPKNISFQPQLRIFYKKPLETTDICLQPIVSINQTLQTVVHRIDTLCKSLLPTSFYPRPIDWQVTVQPNPFWEKTLITFKNPTQKMIQFQLFNHLGQKIGGEKYGTTNQIMVSSKHLSEGLYFFQLSCQQNFFTGKLVLKQ